MKHTDLTDGLVQLLNQRWLWPEHWTDDDVCMVLANITREHLFHSTRKWRFDLAFPSVRVAIEMQGGIWTRGRHSRGKGYQNDCEKQNAAVERGWAVLNYTSDDLKSRPHDVVSQIVAVIDRQIASGVKAVPPNPSVSRAEPPKPSAVKRVIKSIRG